jgi:hypothetical protein
LFNFAEQRNFGLDHGLRRNQWSRIIGSGSAVRIRTTKSVLVDGTPFGLYKRATDSERT